MMKITKTAMIFGLLVVMVLMHPFGRSHGAESESPHPMVSLKAENEDLTDVLAKISKATGYEIIFDKEWGTVPVSVQLNNESLESAIGRVLGNLNHAVIWNEPEKKISVLIYGYVNGRAGGGPPAGISRSRSTGGYRPSQSEENRRSRRDYSTRSPGVRSTPVRPPTGSRSARRSSTMEAGDTEVSISGRKTRFEQATKTTTE